MQVICKQVKATYLSSEQERLCTLHSKPAVRQNPSAHCIASMLFTKAPLHTA